jgi:hypothetical protein
MLQIDYTRQLGHDRLVTQDNMVVTKPDYTRQHGCYRLITQNNMGARLITQDNLDVTD